MVHGHGFAILFLLANRAKYFSTWAGRRWRRVCSSTRLKGMFIRERSAPELLAAPLTALAVQCSIRAGVYPS